MFKLKNPFAAFSGYATLGRRAARAGTWSVAELGISNALRLSSNLVMTRLLMPEAFGVMAMITTLHVALILFTDIGIQQSIVRSPRGAEAHFLRVAWVVQIFRSTGIALAIVIAGTALWFLAPGLAPAGTVYADPDLPALIIMSSLIMVLKGFESNAQWLAARQMRFARTTTLNLFSQAVALISMVALAQIEATVWALLFGQLIGAVVKAVLSHFVLEGPRMAFEWNKEIADELWGFGKWLLVSSAFTFFAKNADRLILGALLGKDAFGLYVIAFTWIQVVTMVIGKLSGQIGFPVLSEVMQQRPDDVPRVFRRLSRFVDILCGIGFVAAVLGGNFLISFLYPPTYAAAGALMPLLSLIILQTRFNILPMLLLSSGDSKSMMLNSGIAAITLCIALPLGFRYLGIDGALIAVALAPLASAPVIMMRASRLLGRQIRIDIIWFFAIMLCAVLIYGVFHS